MDIAVSVVADNVSKLVDTAIRQARYSFQFNKYVKDLEIEKVNLQFKIESIHCRAQEAKKKTEKTVNAVDEWLNKADSLMAKVVEMEEKAKKRNKTYCIKCCPNWFRRYGLAKKLEEKINEIIEHNKKEFPEFSRLATLVGMNYFSSEAFVHFNSRKVAYDGLLEALKDDKVHMIGLYGMGGCGKTTLIKEVGKEAEQFFDKVIFVIVSNTVHVRNIQGKIASQLDLKLEEEEEPERARRLFMRLNGGERFLIILDDVWEMLDFEAIGIPIGENKFGCTVLITTRHRHVCTSMNCQSMTALDLLNMEEALTLFQKHAKLFDDNSETLNLKGLAQEITKECGGLPVAIAAVASTLKGKTQVEWVEALETLRDSSPVDIEEGLKNPYTCLQLSCDNLKNEVAKSLFLLCSVFSEDYEIVIDNLAIFGIALGLVGEIHSLKRARDQVSIAINKLVDSCLLLRAKKNGVISMHDLVRDVALWIAKKDNKIIMGSERSQKVLKVDMILKDNTIRYLWLEQVDKFPHKLDCPNLEFLRISLKSKHCIYVTNEFLNGIKKLRVLFLENSSLKQVLQLPKSIYLIHNLRYLLLDGWLLGDISLIGSLEKLVSLTLTNCSFNELPKSISELKNLRLLHISECDIERNPNEVIGRCSQLEELYFYCNEGKDWGDKGENAIEFFDKISARPRLERYSLEIGKIDDNEVHDLNSSTITRVLSVNYFDSCITNETIKDLMQRAHALSLARINSCKNFVPGCVQRIGGDMNELTILALFDSDEIEYVIDIPNHLALSLVRIISNLTHLVISGMKHLKTLYNGHPPQGLFANLEILVINECNSLEQIITDEVEEIVVDDNEYQRNYSLAFPNLKELCISECNQLEYIFPVSYTQSFPQLSELTIEGAAKLKNIFGQSNYKDQNPNEFHIIELLALRELTLYNLPNVISICSGNYYARWPSLESLDLRKCPQLTTMSLSNHSVPCAELTQDHTSTKDVMEIHLENLTEVVLKNLNIDVLFYLEGQQMNSGLYHLGLEDLPELRHIWICPKNLLQLQNLSRLDIRKCEILKFVFPATIARSLPQLRELIIMDCKELEEIIEEENKEENQNVLNPQLLFPNLTTIIIRHCHKLKRVFPVFTSRVLPKLKVLWIEEASQLEQVFGDEEEERTDKMEGVMIPNLKYVILMKLPKLKMGPQWIELQTVSHCLVQDSQYLNFTSTAATLEELHKICKSGTVAEFDLDFWTLVCEIENIIKPNEDSRREINKQIHSKKTEDEALSDIEDISSPIKTNQNNSGIHSKLKLIPTASPNLNESQNKTKKEIVGEVCALEIPVAMATSSTNPEFEIANNEILPGTKSVDKPEDQSTNKEKNISEGMSVERNFKEGCTPENAKTVISLIHSEPAQSLPSPSVTSLPKAFPLLVNKRSASEPSSTDQQQPLGEDEDQSFKEGNISEETNTVNVKINIEKGSTSEIAKAFPSLPKAFSHSVKQPEDENSSAQEENMSEKTAMAALSTDSIAVQSVKGSTEESTTLENAKIVISSAHSKPGSSLGTCPLVTSPPKAFLQVYQPETDNSKDIEASSIVDLQDFEDDSDQLSIPSFPIVATTEDDDLVAKALEDLELFLKMPLKDIATSETNSLRLLTALNFLSRLSFEDGAFPHGLKAIIESLHQDFPSILKSFSPAFAATNKLSKFVNEAQEKEAKLKEQMEQISSLEKEIEDCEAKLSSLQEQKKKIVAKTKELKDEFESVRKEKSKVVDDQRKSQQQLFQVDYRWSVLCSQFQLNNIIATRNPS